MLSILRKQFSKMRNSHCKTSLQTMAPLTLSTSMKTYILQLDQGKAGLCCHRKKLSSAQRITVPSFPASLPSWHGMARNANNLREITNYCQLYRLQEAVTGLGCVGPLAALAASSPRAAASTIVVSWHATRVCHPLLAHPHRHTCCLTLEVEHPPATPSPATPPPAPATLLLFSSHRDNHLLAKHPNSPLPASNKKPNKIDPPMKF